MSVYINHKISRWPAKDREQREKHREAASLISFFFFTLGLRVRDQFFNSWAIVKPIIGSRRFSPRAYGACIVCRVKYNGLHLSLWCRGIWDKKKNGLFSAAAIERRVSLYSFFSLGLFALSRYLYSLRLCAVNDIRVSIYTLLVARESSEREDGTSWLDVDRAQERFDLLESCFWFDWSAKWKQA